MQKIDFAASALCVIVGFTLRIRETFHGRSRACPKHARRDIRPSSPLVVPLVLPHGRLDRVAIFGLEAAAMMCVDSAFRSYGGSGIYEKKGELP